MENKNPFDEMLKKTLEGGPNGLPDNMLDRILKKKEEKKRLFFYWSLFSSVLLIIASLGFYANRKYEFNHQKNQRKAIQAATSNKLANAESSSKNSPIKQGQIAKATVAEKSTSLSETAFNSGEIKSVKDVYLKKVQQNHVETLENAGMVNPLLQESNADDFSKYFKKDSVMEISTNKEQKTSIYFAEIRDSINTAEAEHPKAQAIATLDSTSRLKATSMLGKNIPELVFSLGYVGHSISVGFAVTDLNYFNKNYQSMISKATRSTNGAQLSMGVRSAIYSKFFITAGISYVYNNLTMKYQTTIREVPVVDQDQRIVGYLNLSDSNAMVINSTSNTHLHQFVVPLMLGYKFNISSKYELNTGVGLLPSYTVSGRIMLPAKVNVGNLSSEKLKNQFSMPMNATLSVLRKMRYGRLGLCIAASPIKSKTAGIPGVGVIRASTLEFGFQWLSKF